MVIAHHRLATLGVAGAFLCLAGGLLPAPAAGAAGAAAGAADAAAGTADAAPSTADSAPAAAAASDGSIAPIVVTAQRLNEARLGVETQTGASTYTLDNQAIVAQPGGGNQPLNQAPAAAPG